MNWKFWQKSTPGTQGNTGKKEAKPKELPQVVGRHMVVDLGLDPDWVWGLKIVTKEREGEKGILDFRLYDPAATPLKITGFSSLDGHADLILYDGWYEKDGNGKELIPRSISANQSHTAA